MWTEAILDRVSAAIYVNLPITVNGLVFFCFQSHNLDGNQICQVAFVNSLQSLHAQTCQYKVYKTEMCFINYGVIKWIQREKTESPIFACSGVVFLKYHKENISPFTWLLLQRDLNKMDKLNMLHYSPAIRFHNSAWTSKPFCFSCKNHRNRIEKLSRENIILVFNIVPLP